MVAATRTRWCAGLLLAALALVGAGCGDGTGDQVTSAGPTTSAAATATTAAEPTTTAAPPGDLTAFCAAVDQLEATDGRTAEDVALAALFAVRRTAPAAIRDDVILVSDNLIIFNYPSGVEPSMRESPLPESHAASERLGAFHREHCGSAG